MSAIDHAALAVEMLEVADHSDSIIVQTNAVAKAQVHATLALAKQQRVANIIAAFAEHGFTSDVTHLGYSDWSSVIADVRDGMGLA